MAGMKRFVTYIYSYEDKKKGSNTGFAKIEIRGEECRIEIHLRGVYIGQNNCKVYLFKEDAGDMEGFAVGEIKIINGNGDFSVITRTGQLGESSFSIYDMEGLFLLGEDERVFMSRWKEGAPLEVCREHFHEWGKGAADSEKQRPKKETESLQEQTDLPNQPTKAQQREQMVRNGQTVRKAQAAQNVQPEQKMQASQKMQSNQKMQPNQNVQSEPVFEAAMAANLRGNRTQEAEVQNQKNMQEEAENIAATEVPMRNIFPQYQWSEIWENLQKSHPVFTPFRDKKLLCVRIELRDLRELPKRDWYLGNNSFLLHGFFNYRYLVIGKSEEERWYIGVPGIYQHQERVMAAIFGFPEFIPVALEGENEEEENTQEEPMNRFGYWYRFLEE